MHVIDDDRFGVGFEFEFVVADADLLVREREFVQVCCLNWNKFKHSFELIDSKKLSWVESILSFQEYQNLKTRWNVDYEECAEKFGWARLIAMLRLQPRAKHWYYKNKKGEFLLRTALIKQAMLDLDPRDEDAVKRFSKRIGRYYVRMVELEKYGGMTKSNTDKMFERVIDVLDFRTGHEFTRLTYENDDLSKDSPGWYLVEEDVEDMRDYYIDSCLEITTPVMTPREALQEYRNVSDALMDFPVSVYTTSDCGLHINISHPDIDMDDVSILEFSLMYDEVAMAKPFGRNNNNACEAYRKSVRKKIRELVRDRVISLAAFDNDPSMMMQFIESSIEMQKMSSMNLGSLNKYGFVEYRIPGGKRYLQKRREVRKHLIELLNIHQSFGEHNYAMRRKVRRLLVEFKADRNDGVSLIEMVPETIFKP